MSIPATPKADRVLNRAPKGGVLDPTSNVFYKGGQFVPFSALEAVKPAPLTGSSRQCDWARRLRAAKLAKIDAQLESILFGLDTIKPMYRSMFRPEIKSLQVERFQLIRTTSAVAIIDAR